MSFNKKSEKYLSAEESLPKDLHLVYEQLVEEYIFHTVKRYGGRYVSFSVLADLVRDGWRPPEKAKNTK